jgi:hypothetical protein
MSMNCGGHDLLGTPKVCNNPLNWKTQLNIALNAAQGSKHCDQSLFFVHTSSLFYFIFSKENCFFNLLLNHFH